MNKTFLLAATAAASIALAACNNEPEVIGTNRYDPQAEALKNAAPVAPPPMVSASKTYRCSDNSLFYVDFYSDNTATIRTEQTGSPTSLTSTNGAPPFIAPGYSVSGNGNNVRITAPGHNNVACHI
ncbi:hypothetical protein [Sphingosinicella sp.]|uniref:hypothetical protein n=1 Tax=Sphingosinicella sp. TaxID=1917971 RepID=UPI004037CF92